MDFISAYLKNKFSYTFFALNSVVIMQIVWYWPLDRKRSDKSTVWHCSVEKCQRERAGEGDREGERGEMI